jgi:hypothetical protein
MKPVGRIFAGYVKCRVSVCAVVLETQDEDRGHKKRRMVPAINRFNHAAGPVLFGTGPDLAINTDLVENGRPDRQGLPRLYRHGDQSYRGPQFLDHAVPDILEIALDSASRRISVAATAKHLSDLGDVVFSL